MKLPALAFRVHEAVPHRKFGGRYFWKRGDCRSPELGRPTGRPLYGLLLFIFCLIIMGVLPGCKLMPGSTEGDSYAVKGSEYDTQVAIEKSAINYQDVESGTATINGTCSDPGNFVDVVVRFYKNQNPAPAHVGTDLSDRVLCFTSEGKGIWNYEFPWPPPGVNPLDPPDLIYVHVAHADNLGQGVSAERWLHVDVTRPAYTVTIDTDKEVKGVDAGGKHYFRRGEEIVFKVQFAEAIEYQDVPVLMIYFNNGSAVGGAENITAVPCKNLNKNPGKFLCTYKVTENDVQQRLTLVAQPLQARPEGSTITDSGGNAYVHGAYTSDYEMAVQKGEDLLPCYVSGERPSVREVSAAAKDGGYGIGEDIVYTITFTSPVWFYKVSGSGTCGDARITFGSGQGTTYQRHCTGATALATARDYLTCTLHIEEGMKGGSAAKSLTYSSRSSLTSPSGCQILDEAYNLADLKLPAELTVIPPDGKVIADGIRPKIASIYFADAEGHNLTGKTNYAKAGDRIYLKFTFNEDIATHDAGTIGLALNINAGKPSVDLDDCTHVAVPPEGQAWTARDVRCSYLVEDGDDTDDYGIGFASSELNITPLEFLTDMAGNYATRTFPRRSQAMVLDTIAPHLVDGVKFKVRSNSAYLGAGHNVTINAYFNEPLKIDVPAGKQCSLQLALADTEGEGHTGDPGHATCTSVANPNTGGGALVCQYTVPAGLVGILQAQANGLSCDPGVKLTDNAGNDALLAFAENETIKHITSEGDAPGDDDNMTVYSGESAVVNAIYITKVGNTLIDIDRPEDYLDKTVGFSNLIFRLKFSRPVKVNNIFSIESNVLRARMVEEELHEENVFADCAVSSENKFSQFVTCTMALLKNDQLADGDDYIAIKTFRWEDQDYPGRTDSMIVDLVGNNVKNNNYDTPTDKETLPKLILNAAMPVVREVNVEQVNDDPIAKDEETVVAIGTQIHFALTFKNSLTEADELVAVLTPTPAPGMTPGTGEIPPQLKLNLVPQDFEPSLEGNEPEYALAACAPPEDPPVYSTSLACVYTVEEGKKIYKSTDAQWPYLDYIEGTDDSFLGKDYYLKNKIDLPPEQNKVMALPAKLMVQVTPAPSPSDPPTYKGYLLRVDAIRPQVAALELVPPLQSGVPKPVAPDGYYHIGAFDEEGLVLRAHFSEGMQTAAEEATPVGELHIGVREDPAGMFAVPCNFAPPLEYDTPEESIYACILNPIEGQRSLAQPLVPDGASSGTAEDDFKHYFLIFTPMALASDYAFKINTEDDRESFKDKAGNYPDTISTVGPATTEGPPPEPEYFLKMAFPFGEMPFKVAQTINGVPTYVDFDPADTTGTKPKGIILNDGQKLKIYRMEVEVRPEDKKEYNGKIYIRKDSAINFKYFFTHEITKQKDDAQYFLPLSVQEGVTPEEEIIYGAATCDVISASEIPLDESTTLAKNNILNCTYLVTENSTTNNEVLKYKAHHLLEPEWGSGAALLLEEAEGEEGQNFLTDYAGNGIPQTKASFQVGPHLAYYPYNEGVMAEDFGIYIDGIEPHFTEIEVDGVVPLRNYTNTLRKGDKISWHFTFNESIVQAGAAAQAAAGNNTLDPINPYFKICRRENAEQNRDDLPVLLKDWREEDISEICILNEDGIDQLCCEDSNAAAVICVMDPPGPEPEKTGMTCSYTVQEGDYSNHLKYTSFAKLVMFNYEKWIDNSGNNIASPLNVFRAQPAAEETVDGWKTILTYRMDGEAPELLEVTSDKHANEDSTEEVFVPHNSYINIFLSFEGPVGGKERLVVSPMETDQPYIMLNVHRGDADKIKVPCYPMADKDFHKLRCPYKVEDGDYTPVISYDPETNYPIRASITIQSFGGVVSDEYGNQIDVRKTNRILRGKEKGYGHINLGVDGKQPIKIISASKSTAKVDAIRIDDRILPGSYTYNDNQLKYYFIDHCPYYGDCANTLVFHVYFNEPIQGSAKLRLNVKDKEYKALPTADAECRVLNPPPVSNALTCSLIIDDGYETHSADGQEEYLEYVSIYGLMKTEGGDGITDMAGNPANVVLPAINPDPLTSRSLSASQIVLDSNYPKVLSISSRDKVGTVFKSGQVINVQVNFSERIYANGDEFLLRLKVNDDLAHEVSRDASCYLGPSKKQVECFYTVKDGENTTGYLNYEGIYALRVKPYPDPAVDPVAGFIADFVLNRNLDDGTQDYAHKRWNYDSSVPDQDDEHKIILPKVGDGNDLAALKFKISTTGPRVTKVYPETEPPEGYIYRVGEIISLVVEFSEEVVVKVAENSTSPELILQTKDEENSPGSSNSLALYSKTEGNKVYFSYQVKDKDYSKALDYEGLQSLSGFIESKATHLAANLTLPDHGESCLENAQIKVDGRAPYVTQITALVKNVAATNSRDSYNLIKQGESYSALNTTIYLMAVFSEKIRIDENNPPQLVLNTLPVNQIVSDCQVINEDFLPQKNNSALLCPYFISGRDYTGKTMPEEASVPDYLNVIQVRGGIYRLYYKGILNDDNTDELAHHVPADLSDDGLAKLEPNKNLDFYQLQILPFVIAGGDYHTCVLHQQHIQCAGLNSYHQLGNLDQDVLGEASTLSDVRRFGQADHDLIVDVAAGGNQSGGIKFTDEWYDIYQPYKTYSAGYLWGNNNLTNNGVVRQTFNDGPFSIKQLAMGKEFACAVGQKTYVNNKFTDEAAVYCWGKNDEGQLGNPDAASAHLTQPIRVAGLAEDSAIDQITAGPQHACALWADPQKKQHLSCWGNNRYRQIAPTSADAYVGQATEVSLDDKIALPIKMMSAGDGFTCLLDHKKHVWCQGSQNLGRLGNGVAAQTNALWDLVKTEVPTENGQKMAVTLDNVLEITSGTAHTCAKVYKVLTDSSGNKNDDATIYCWGSNESGQLGFVNAEVALGSQSSAYQKSAYAVPVIVPGTTDPVEHVGALGAGSKHTCATIAGLLRCWGNNSNGQLANGTSNDRYYTYVTAKNLGAVSLEGNYGHHGLIKAGLAYLLGHNTYGQLGTGTLWSSTFDEGAYLLPVREADDGEDVFPVEQLALGDGYSCLLKNNARYCWGNNNGSRLGLGDIENQKVTFPQRRNKGPTGVDEIEHDIYSAIGGASNFACGIIHTAHEGYANDLRCWGMVPGHDVVKVPQPPEYKADKFELDRTDDGKFDDNKWWQGVSQMEGGSTDICLLRQTSNLEDSVVCLGSHLTGGAARGNLLSNDQTKTDYQVQKIGVSKHHACALIAHKRDAASNRVRCWGERDYLGNGVVHADTTPYPNKDSIVKNPQDVQILKDGAEDNGSSENYEPLTNVIDLAIGTDHSCAMVQKDSGAQEIWCWGGNYFGQVDGQDGSTTLKITAQKLLPQSEEVVFTKIVAISAGDKTSCYLDASSGVDIRCFGKDFTSNLSDMNAEIFPVNSAMDATPTFDPPATVHPHDASKKIITQTNTGTITFKIIFKQNINLNSSGLVYLNSGGVATCVAGPGPDTNYLVCTYTPGENDDTNGDVLDFLGIDALEGEITDPDGHPIDLSLDNIMASSALASQNIIIDNKDPTVVSISVDDGAGNKTYVHGEEIKFYVNLSEAVQVVMGTPTVQLKIGGNQSKTANCPLDEAAGPNQYRRLVCSYTVQSDDYTGDDYLSYVNQNALVGNITDFVNHGLVSTLPDPNDTSLRNNLIVHKIKISGKPRIVEVGINGTIPATRTYSTGDTIKIKVVFDQNIAFTEECADETYKPVLGLNIYPIAREAKCAEIEGNKLICTYDVVEMDAADPLDYKNEITIRHDCTITLAGDSDVEADLTLPPHKGSANIHGGCDGTGTNPACLAAKHVKVVGVGKVGIASISFLDKNLATLPTTSGITATQELIYLAVDFTGEVDFFDGEPIYPVLNTWPVNKILTGCKLVDHDDKSRLVCPYYISGGDRSIPGIDLNVAGFLGNLHRADNINSLVDLTPPNTTYCTLNHIIFAGGSDHACITAQDHAQCVGSNAHQQLGIDLTSDQLANATYLVDTKVLGYDITRMLFGISASGDYTVALRRENLGTGTEIHAYEWGQLLTTTKNVPTIINNFIFRQVAVGRNFACGIGQFKGPLPAMDTQEKVYCWGNNLQHQLGVNNTSDGAGGDDQLLAPTAAKNVALGGLDAELIPAQLVAGKDFACGIWQKAKHDFSEQHLYCWGKDFGRITSALPTELEVTDATPTNPIKQLSAGEDFVCLLLNNEKVVCKGLQTNGRLGNNRTSGTASAWSYVKYVKNEAITNLENVTEISSGLAHTCAKVHLADHSATRLYCWGKNDHKQVGLAASSYEIATLIKLGEDPLVQLGVLNAGDNHTCVTAATSASDEGLMRCWGDNHQGQLGNGERGNDVPVYTTLARHGALEFVGNYGHRGYIVEGLAYLWGTNAHQELGIAEFMFDFIGVPHSFPVRTGYDAEAAFWPVEQLVLGEEYSCAISLGRPYCWGSGAGQRNGGSVDRTFPGLVTGLSNEPGYTSLGTAQDFGCAIFHDLEGDKLSCWGDARPIPGTLGNPGTLVRDDAPEDTFTDAELNTVHQMAGGDKVMCMLRQYKDVDQAVSCFAKTGEIFDKFDGGTPGKVRDTFVVGADESEDPIFKTMAKNRFVVTKVGVGTNFACALFKNNEIPANTTMDHVRCWGQGMYLGAGLEESQDALGQSPQVVLGGGGQPLANVRDLAVGRNHACALVRDGGDRIYCWGHNDRKQFGDTLGEIRRTASTELDGILTLNSVKALMAGDGTTCYLQDESFTQHCHGLRYTYDPEP